MQFSSSRSLKFLKVEEQKELQEIQELAGNAV